ncbi:MAG: hypothetical protein J7647_20395 [Cyanobacteria bacterium SBLK]|nr:hypothetical protein [Cyanobacteria bacterium SBLK]
MQYLARVQNNSASGIELQLLAKHAVPDNVWVVDDVSRSVHLENGKIPDVSAFVVVELDERGVPEAIEDVTDWLFASLQQEEKIQWRQELTLESQELTIRNLELEARREKMEQEFKKRQRELERREEALQLREKQLVEE